LFRQSSSPTPASSKYSQSGQNHSRTVWTVGFGLPGI
jgi:hypothetical protein